MEKKPKYFKCLVKLIENPEGHARTQAWLWSRMEWLAELRQLNKWKHQQ